MSAVAFECRALGIGAAVFAPLWQNTADGNDSIAAGAWSEELHFGHVGVRGAVLSNCGLVTREQRRTHASHACPPTSAPTSSIASRPSRTNRATAGSSFSSDSRHPA